MVALDVQLQSAGRGVLLRAAGVRAHVRLRLTTPYDPHVGRALVDLQVLLEVLLVVELLAAVRLGAHEVARTVHLVRAHVHVQVALPVEHSTPHAPAPRALVAAGVGALVLRRATRQFSAAPAPVGGDDGVGGQRVGVRYQQRRVVLVVQLLRLTLSTQSHRQVGGADQIDGLAHHVDRALQVALVQVQEEQRHLLRVVLREQRLQRVVPALAARQPQQRVPANLVALLDVAPKPVVLLLLVLLPLLVLVRLRSQEGANRTSFT